MRSDKERFLDILEAIEKIEQQVGRNRVHFNRDPMLQVWVVHYMQIIGEAASRLSDQIQTSHPEIPWGKIIGMRHVLVHGYFEIDLTLVWEAVERDIPELKLKVSGILAGWEEGGRN
jgi:uncharacterized protein with HEPN domain